ncbi:MAG TPA: hypothetical protein VFS40_09950 [Gemmatimonadales bacterium]|nr:hypothetical protein [Gemmatimonadales bacterium]
MPASLRPLTGPLALAALALLLACEAGSGTFGTSTPGVITTGGGTPIGTPADTASPGGPGSAPGGAPGSGAEALRITPFGDTVSVGDSVRFAAVVLDASGVPAPGRIIHWSVTDTTVAIVDASGLVHTRRPGLDSIVAASGTLTSAAILVVVDTGTTPGVVTAPPLPPQPPESLPPDTTAPPPPPPPPAPPPPDTGLTRRG